MQDSNRTNEGALRRDDIRNILDASLLESDFFCRKSRGFLEQKGLKKDEALISLAEHKSRVKYGYLISSHTLTHLLALAGEQKAQALGHLIESPFFFLSGQRQGPGS
jgi:hypothetical protein